jgi:hypothetical protein
MGDKSVIDPLMKRIQAAGMIDESSRSGRPRKSTPRENRLIVTGVPHHICSSVAM